MRHAFKGVDPAHIRRVNFDILLDLVLWLYTLIFCYDTRIVFICRPFPC